MNLISKFRNLFKDNSVSEMGDSVAPKYSLRDLGYAFNKKGELRSISDDEPFEFTTQENYEMLGDAMTHEIYNLLESVGLQRIILKKQTDKKPDENYSFVFASPDFDLKETLLVLIHGSGAVRAGQWARRLILNENLDRGSQLPYIERAMANGWGVLVTNCNNNAHLIDRTTVPLVYSRDHEKHIENVWYRFVRYARCSTIHVVAHSRGGHDISHLMDTLPGENRVDCICLTDSWFEFSRDRMQQPIVINWAARSKDSIRKPVEGERVNKYDKVHQIWAGTDQHERSSYMAIDSIFCVLENRPNKDNIDRLLVEAWDIMDPPELESAIGDEGIEDELEEGEEAVRGLQRANIIMDDEDEEYNISVDIESIGHEEVVEEEIISEYSEVPSCVDLQEPPVAVKEEEVFSSVKEEKPLQEGGDYPPDSKRPRSE